MAGELIQVQSYKELVGILESLYPNKIDDTSFIILNEGVFLVAMDRAAVIKYLVGVRRYEGSVDGLSDDNTLRNVIFKATQDNGDLVFSPWIMVRGGLISHPVRTLKMCFYIAVENSSIKVLESDDIYDDVFSVPFKEYIRHIGCEKDDPYELKTINANLKLGWDETYLSQDNNPFYTVTIGTGLAHMPKDSVIAMHSQDGTPYLRWLSLDKISRLPLSDYGKNEYLIGPGMFTIIPNNLSEILELAVKEQEFEDMRIRVYPGLRLSKKKQNALRLQIAGYAYYTRDRIYVPYPTNTELLATIEILRYHNVIPHNTTTYYLSDMYAAAQLSGHVYTSPAHCDIIGNYTEAYWSIQYMCDLDRAIINATIKDPSKFLYIKDGLDEGRLRLALKHQVMNDDTFMQEGEFDYPVERG